ncbi:MAG: hypothetical protein QXI19_06970 [Candidatus Caldarchaeum sp.]
MKGFPTKRFPIFATWCYVVAKRMGLDEDEARSLAYTRAVLGAAAKAGYLRGGNGKSQGAVVSYSPHGTHLLAEAVVETMPFVGMRPYVARTALGLRGVLKSNGRLQVVDPVEFSKVQRDLGEHFGEVQGLLEALASRFEPGELNKRGYEMWRAFAPMAKDAKGQERPPGFGERCYFNPKKVEALLP